MLSPRNRVLRTLRGTPDGVSFDDLIVRSEYRAHTDGLEVLLQNLRRNREIFSCDGRWFHKSHLSQLLLAERQQYDRAVVKSSPEIKIKEVDLKLRTLESLSEITEASISRILKKIKVDLIKLNGLH